jgi:hypothetical protein
MLIFFGKYSKVLVQCDTQSGFKDPLILYVTGLLSSVFVLARLEVLMLQDHKRVPDENQSLTIESVADV